MRNTWSNQLNSLKTIYRHTFSWCTGVVPYAYCTSVGLHDIHVALTHIGLSFDYVSTLLRWTCVPIIAMRITSKLKQAWKIIDINRYTLNSPGPALTGGSSFDVEADVHILRLCWRLLIFPFMIIWLRLLQGCSKRRAIFEKAAMT